MPSAHMSSTKPGALLSITPESIPEASGKVVLVTGKSEIACLDKADGVLVCRWRLRNRISHRKVI